MIAQLPVPPIERKIQRDAMKYEINIEFPSKEKEEIDFDRLKKIIKEKVIALVNKEEGILSPNRVSRPEKGRFDHQGRGEDAVMTAYQKFALEYFDFLASLNKAGMKMISNKYQRAGLEFHLIVKTKKIINSVLRAEIKRISAKKPLPTEKQEKMEFRFTKYRVIIEKIEAEVHKLLCASAVLTPLFALYKGYTRECYKVLKRYYGKDEELLKQALAKIIGPWQKQGLKQELLLKVQERVIKTFGSLRMKRMV